VTRTAARIAPVLPVRDVIAALAHYQRLGFSTDAYGENDGDAGPGYGFVCLGPVELHLSRTPALDPAANTSACYVYVSDADALHAEWAAGGVPGRLTAPEDTPYGLREFAHVDPDGNLLRIGSELPPAVTAAGPVREMRAGELPEVTAMMRALWPDAGSYDFAGETVLVFERPGGGLGGFVSFSLRPWAEGCAATPVPYLEGWWVAPELRRGGVGRTLVEAVERWCRAHGHRELGSDVELDNEISLRAHAALGFEPTLRVQFLRKRLG